MPDEKASKPRTPKKRFLKQPQMQRMCYALMPILAAGIYFFGWRVLALLAVNTVGGLATEWAMARRQGKPVSQACFVTILLYSLSLPPTMPFWMSLVGIVVAILFGKMVFGGFGRNFANPAIVGRAFVYVAFPVAMTGSFVPAFRGVPAGFGRWSFTATEAAPEWLAPAAERSVDAVTAATPRRVFKEAGHLAPLSQVFFGHIGGTFQGEYREQVLAGGSIGEVCTPLILLAAVYLIATKTANWRLTLSCVLGATGTVLLFRDALGLGGLPPLLFALQAGSLLYVAVFMVTDPVSAPKHRYSVWIYGALIGALILIIPWKGQFSGAASFSVLIGNMLGPTFDSAFNALDAHWKAKRAKAAGAS